MLQQVRDFFRPPSFEEDEDKTRRAKYANAIAIAFFAAALLYEAAIRIFAGHSDFGIFDLLVFAVAIICAIALVLIKKGYVTSVSFLLVLMTWMASNSISATGFGVRDSSYLLNFAIILMAALLIGWKGSLVVTVITVLVGIGLAYAERSGLILVAPYPVTSFAQDMAAVFVLNAVLIGLLMNGLESALRKSRDNLETLGAVNVNLDKAQTELRSRSADLLTANAQLEDRTRKLHAIAEITRTAAALMDFRELLVSITTIIGRGLGYHHVAIFLLDEERQYAVLRSINAEDGRQGLSLGHRLPVGQLNVISLAAQSGQPRLALDLERDREMFGNAILEETRSQLALPLKPGSETLGVLDIQSTEAKAFGEDDIAVLSILADQVAIALQNAYLFETSQKALQEANRESLQASGRAWERFASALPTRGYRYDGIVSEPLQEPASSRAQSEALTVPVQLRGQTIGRLRLQTSEHSREWSEDELVMIRATAERVALALESVRLLNEAQKRAAREALLSQVAAKLSTSFQMDSILRDTVQELGQTLKNATVTFQLVKPPDSSAADGTRPNGSSGSMPGPGGDHD